MIKISESVEELIRGDEVAFEAHKEKILNLSAYAKKIKPLLEKRLLKPVRKGSIVAALSRMNLDLESLPDLKPDVVVDDISIKSPLGELTYEKTEASQHSVSSLLEKMKSENGFFTITQGINEITIIYPENLKDKVTREFDVKPKGEYSNLVGVTVRFNEKDYVEVPNMVFTLVSALAIKRINLIEIVSTFSEISFIVRRRDMQETIDTFRLFFR